MASLITMYCPACRGEISLDAEREFGYCMYCGAQIMVTNKMRVELTAPVEVKGAMTDDSLVEYARVQMEEGESAEAVEETLRDALKINARNWRIWKCFFDLRALELPRKRQAEGYRFEPSLGVERRQVEASETDETVPCRTEYAWKYTLFSHFEPEEYDEGTLPEPETDPVYDKMQSDLEKAMEYAPEERREELLAVRQALYDDLAQGREGMAPVYERVRAKIEAALVEKQRQWQRDRWDMMGLCRYCGGQINMFGKCKNCGQVRKW